MLIHVITYLQHKILQNERYLISGNPPVNANHVYRLKKHMERFLHPFPTLRNNTGGTLPTPSPCEPIAESLLGLFHLNFFFIVTDKYYT